MKLSHPVQEIAGIPQIGQIAFTARCPVRNGYCPIAEPDRHQRIPLALADHDRLLRLFEQAVVVPQGQPASRVHLVALFGDQPILVVHHPSAFDVGNRQPSLAVAGDCLQPELAGQIDGNSAGFDPVGVLLVKRPLSL
jgi:hypothetical protein